ncbi:hypothetical protein [Microbacterium hominis]|uniref:hypothetical protein n=1 Tax=Microbacterium hominis TaxID=162426 RepID=UPI0012FF3D1E|nr:hypothetical protein [Microbacterium hominis]
MNMAIVLAVAPAVRSRPDLTLGSDRACSDCGQVKPFDQFEVLRDARGKPARRRTCMSCFTSSSSAATRSHPQLRPQLIACAACKRGLPAQRFPVSPESGARRKVCGMCLDSVREAIQDGSATLSEIAERTGVSRATVSSVRDELRIVVTRERITPNQRAAAVELAKTTGPGANPAEIAAQVDAKPGAIRKLLLKEGLISPGVSRAPISPERLAMAKAHLDDGASYREVARTTGIGIKTLIRHFPDMGADRDNRALLGWINGRPELRELYAELNKGLPAVV